MKDTQSPSEIRRAEQLEAAGLLVSVVAHDFKNLLTIISRHCDRSLAQLEPGHFVRNNIEGISKAVASASSLVRRLLAYDQELNNTPSLIDCNVVVRNLVPMIKELIGDRIELIVEIDNHPAPVLAEAVNFEQILLNLAANARDAMTGGGILRIETRYLQETNSVSLILRDTGVGIDNRVLDRIFDPFFSAKRPVGTGLGLWIVKKIVNETAGSIEVSSSAGDGTAFRLVFPCVAVTDVILSGYSPKPSNSIHHTPPIDNSLRTQEYDPGKAEEHSRRHKVRVLVVDDEPEIRGCLSSVLDDYDVACAASGEEAIEIAKRFSPEIILSDITMPGISGIEAIQKLKLIVPESVVIMISGMQTVEAAIGSMRAGAFDYIMKPFDLRHVESSIQRAVSFQDLTKRARRQNDFLSIVSHELRAPLQAPLRHLENVLAGVHGPLDDAQRNILERTAKGIQTEVRLVNNLLDLQYLESGRFQVRRVRVPLTDLVSDTFEFFTAEAIEREVCLLWARPDDPYIMSIDPEETKRAICNLVSNALSHTPRNKRVWIKLFRNSRFAYCIVRDEGVGIQNRYIEKIFDRAFQVPTSRKKGLGIGLYIAREIARAHGGDVRVRSKVNVGSVFMLSLPEH